MPDRKIDKSVTDLLNKDLGGLQGDYSEKVQAIVDEKKHKMLNKGFSTTIQAMKTRLDKEFTLVAELRTISSMIHPTKLTKQLLHFKRDSGEYKNHGQSTQCIALFKENI